MPRISRATVAVWLAAAAACGCGAEGRAGPLVLPADAVPVGVGPGRAYQPAAGWARVDAGRPVGSMRCRAGAGRRVGVHLELFAHGHVVLVPPGIGIARPWRTHGAYVDGGRCSYPIRTREPTGVLEVEPGSAFRLGDVFALWGRPLTVSRLAGFDAGRGRSIRAYVDGRPWRGRPGAIPLRRHASIVLELDTAIPPHPRYRFADGL